MKQLSIVGAGWAGLAGAVAATQAGWHVQIFEAAHTAGGRARSLPQSFAGQPLDNGQHVLIGAYQDTLALMRTVGLSPDALLYRLPLDLQFADGQGLALPDWPQPLNLLAGVMSAPGWTWKDKTSLMRAAWQWQRAQFTCSPTQTVAQLCDDCRLSARVKTQLIEPLCLSALNTPMSHASAEVFLRVLHDALLGGPGSADLLIPHVDLGALLPNACLQWLRARGVQVHLGTRITLPQLEALRQHSTVMLACPSWDAARLTAVISPVWSSTCASLPHAAIATVYLHCKDEGFHALEKPMMALHSSPDAPAQFVFDKYRLSGQHGLLAAVASACELDRDVVAQQVRAQICQQLKLTHVDIVQTVVEKRATLSCHPMLNRPAPFVAEGLWACGDYIQGPYPSTLESAVRSAQQVVAQVSQVGHS